MSNWTLAIPKADLAARKVSNGEGTDVDLPETKEESEGAFVPYHYDPHSYNHFDTNAYPSLLPIILHPIKPARMGGRYELTWDANRCNVWPDRNRDPNTKLQPRHSFCATNTTVLYVEGTSLGTNLFTINWTDGTNTITDLDRVNVDVFCWKGPLNVPQYGTYRYTASGALQGSRWESAVGGSLISSMAQNKSDRYIKWLVGAQVGKARYFVNKNYSWDLPVNVVEVTVETPPDRKVFEVIGGKSAADGGNVITKDQDTGQLIWSKKVVSSMDVSEAVKWKAQIKLQGPPGGRGITNIVVGFVQNIFVSNCHGEYTNTTPKRLTYVAEGKLYLDYPNNTPLAPYYINPSPPEGCLSYFKPASVNDNGRSVLIAEVDRPDATVPRYYERPKWNETNQVLLATYDVVDSIRLAWNFTVYVAASTTDTENGADEVYTGYAKCDWNFTGSGSVGQTNPWPWSPIRRGFTGCSSPRNKDHWDLSTVDLQIKRPFEPFNTNEDAIKLRTQ